MKKNTPKSKSAKPASKAAGKAAAKAANQAELKSVPAPRLPYKPRKPKSYKPVIGIIGCGGISHAHLSGYRKMGWKVAAFCDVSEAAAAKRRDEFNPKGAVFTDHRALLDRPDIDVIDIATHPAVRGPQVRDALEAGKHVLSQKPFVLDLDFGDSLVALARQKNLRLAVNQNGRWAPYFSYIRECAKAGVLGDIASVDMTLAWNHTWIRGTAFEKIRHVILYDFAIHWYDIVACLFGERRALSVFANLASVPGQTLAPPMSAHVAMAFDQGLASMAFHAHTMHGVNTERILVTGSKGAIIGDGKNCGANDLTLITPRGRAKPVVEGGWFPDGMAGAMGELLRAIEENREPENSAANNLRSLALCFAGLESTRTGKPEIPGNVRTAGPGCMPES